MKKLNKRNSVLLNSIEAYACSCSNGCGGCSANCNCGIAINLSNEHFVNYNNNAAFAKYSGTFMGRNNIPTK